GLGLDPRTLVCLSQVCNLVELELRLSQCRSVAFQSRTQCGELGRISDDRFSWRHECLNSAVPGQGSVQPHPQLPGQSDRIQRAARVEHVPVGSLVTYAA